MSNNDDNIFLQISKNQRKLDKNQSKKSVEWELYIHDKLSYYNILLPKYYNLENTSSLRLFIMNNYIDHIFINELVSFIINLQNSYYFIHGNLSIDNLFVKLDNNKQVTFLLNDLKYSQIKSIPFKGINKFKDLKTLYKSIYNVFYDELFIYYLNNEIYIYTN